MTSSNSPLRAPAVGKSANPTFYLGQFLARQPPRRDGETDLWLFRVSSAAGPGGRFLRSSLACGSPGTSGSRRSGRRWGDKALLRRLWENAKTSWRLPSGPSPPGS